LRLSTPNKVYDDDDDDDVISASHYTVATAAMLSAVRDDHGRSPSWNAFDQSG